MIDLNSEEYKALIKTAIVDKHKHRHHEKAVKYAQKLAVHVYGNSPEDILNKYRPNENVEIKKYRVDSYEPKTKSLVGKILNVLSNVFNSQLYDITYPELKYKDTGKDLRTYLEEDFPKGFISLISYCKEVLLKKMLADPNGVVVVMPCDPNHSDNEFCKPFPYFYESSKVIDFDADKYFLLKSSRKSVISVDSTFPKKEGEIYYLIDDTNIIEIKQVGNESERKFESKMVYTHNIGYVPVFQIGGMEEMEDEDKYYCSFIDGVLSHWNDAIRLDSDLQACYVNHIYPERAEIEQDCKQCSGQGKNVNDNGDLANCRGCGGTGRARSPYGTIYFTPDNFGEGSNNTLFPGVKYIEKDITIVEILERKVELEYKKGLEAVNMDIVDKIGENQSGIAKMYDRSELNSFLLKVSDNIWQAYKEIVFFVCAYRYKKILGNFESQSPNIKKPTKFDILTDEQLVAEIKIAKESGSSSEYTSQLSLQQAKMRFGEDSVAYRRIETILVLNPLPERTTDEILGLSAINAIAKEDLYLYANISNLATEASMQDPEFWSLSLKERKDVLITLAKDKLGKLPNISNAPTIPVQP